MKTISKISYRIVSKKLVLYILFFCYILIHNYSLFGAYEKQLEVPSNDLPQNSSTSKEIKLPPAQKEGGKPFLTCVNLRKSIRDIKADELSLQTLSDLLWCACGVNRTDSGKRTIASARNWQIVRIIVVLPDGAYWYNEQNHTLELIISNDIRKYVATQEYAQKAYLNVLFVADYSKFPQELSEDNKLLYAAYEVGAISQNIYLFCASSDLATVVRASFNKEELAKTLSLGSNFNILLVQTIGYMNK